MADIPYVYEVIGETEDEGYYTLGIFLTEPAARSMLDGEEPPSNDDGLEEMTIEVRRRPVGFHPHEYTVIASQRWARNYNDEKADWIRKPTLPKVTTTEQMRFVFDPNEAQT
jgi:hypothetical protein